MRAFLKKCGCQEHRFRPSLELFFFLTIRYKFKEKTDDVETL